MTKTFLLLELAKLEKKLVDSPRITNRILQKFYALQKEIQKEIEIESGIFDEAVNY